MKRLLVFSDGTWADPEKETLTNVYNLATCVKHQSDGVQQLVFYDPGIGTDGSWMDRVVGGVFGEGIDLNIQQLYTFLAMNYEDGDEIMLFGYSRGAYTVRSLAGMIREAGLVGRHKLNYVKEAYDLYRENGNPENNTAKEFRKNHSRRVPITLLACFDTVGALGLPEGIAPKSERQKYEFHDTKLSSDIKHAVHLLSIDEDRKAFAPTLMEGSAEQVTQLYMPGGHGGVGGGSEQEVDLSNNALLVMVEECEKRCSIGLDKDLLPKEFAKSIPVSTETSPRHKVMKFFTGQYHRSIPRVDMLHSSVYERYQNVKEWRPPSLRKFRHILLKGPGASK